MKHIAKRLVKYADKNKVISISNVNDAALQILLKDKTVVAKVRASLKDIDKQLELLIPRAVDDKEKQFKRFLQRDFGLVVNLSVLQRDHPSRYRKLQLYGNPQDVLNRWGMYYTYDSKIPDSYLPTLLKKYTEKDGVTIKGLFQKDKKLYWNLLYKSQKENKRLGDYLKELGFIIN